MELVHHQFLGGKLVDDLFCNARFGGHVADVEPDVEFVFVLQVGDTTCGSELEFLVVGADLYVAEADRVVSALHRQAEVEGHCEVLQHRGEHSGDIFQVGRTCDDTRRIGELASFFLAGQHDCTAGDIEDGTLLLENDVTQINLVLYIHELCLELADVDAGDGVLGRELIQMARDAILADGVEYYVEISDDVEVLGIKETALGLACVLARQMVVILVVCLFCRRTESPFVCIDGQMTNGGQIVHHDIALLPQRLPMVFCIVDIQLGNLFFKIPFDRQTAQGGREGLQTFLERGVADKGDAFYLSGLTTDPAIVILGLLQVDVEFVVLHMDVLQQEVADIKFQFSLRLLFLFLFLFLVLGLLEGFDDELVVGRLFL